jgi:hypothetical protein
LPLPADAHQVEALQKVKLRLSATYFQELRQRLFPAVYLHCLLLLPARSFVIAAPLRWIPPAQICLHLEDRTGIEQETVGKEKDGLQGAGNSCRLTSWLPL